MKHITLLLSLMLLMLTASVQAVELDLRHPWEYSPAEIEEMRLELSFAARDAGAMKTQMMKLKLQANRSESAEERARLNARVGPLREQLIEYQKKQIRLNEIIKDYDIYWRTKNLLEADRRQKAQLSNTPAAANSPSVMNTPVATNTPATQ